MFTNTLILLILVSPVQGARLGARTKEAWKGKPVLGSGVSGNDHRKLNAEDCFLVSQASQSEDWCIIAPELNSPYQPSHEEGKLGFGHCEPYFDGYPHEGSLQLFRLADDGKMHSGANPDLCMIANGITIGGGGLMRLDDCNINSDLNRFTYDMDTKNIRLAPPNDRFCVTNEGSSPNQRDAIYALPCGIGGRYEYELQEARYYWQILGNVCFSQGPACMMSKNGAIPTRGDKVFIDHCGSPQDAWWFEETGTGAVLFHNKLDVSMCMQSGHGGQPHDGTKLRFYPCDSSNDLQRFVRDLANDGYIYKITPETQSNLCVVNQGSTCSIGDEVILKDCSTAAVDIEAWYDDEG